jgi:hypothetical protein
MKAIIEMNNNSILYGVKVVNHDGIADVAVDIKNEPLDGVPETSLRIRIAAFVFRLIALGKTSGYLCTSNHFEMNHNLRED